MPEPNVNYIKYLIGLSQRGRKNSFIELFELNLKPIYTLTARTLADKEITAEVVKEVFLSAWQNIKFVREDISITAWLSSIAVFEIMEELRTKDKRKKIYGKVGNNGTEVYNPVSTGNDIERQIIELPELERVIIVLHDIEGYNASEISGLFGDLSLKEVRRILNIARQTLTEHLTL